MAVTHAKWAEMKVLLTFNKKMIQIEKKVSNSCKTISAKL